VTHHPALDYEQIKPFMAALRDDDCMAARALEFLILTATRSGDVRFMTCGEINLDKQLWTIPKTRLKTGIRKTGRTMRYAQRARNADLAVDPGQSRTGRLCV
jgi:integrase